MFCLNVLIDTTVIKISALTDSSIVVYHCLKWLTIQTHKLTVGIQKSSIYNVCVTSINFFCTWHTLWNIDLNNQKRKNTITYFAYSWVSNKSTAGHKSTSAPNLDWGYFGNQIKVPGWLGKDDSACDW